MEEEDEEEEEEAEEREDEAAEDLGAGAWPRAPGAADGGPASEAAVCLGVGSSGAGGWLSQAAAGVREEFPWVAVVVVAGAALWLSWLESQVKDNS